MVKDVIYGGIVELMKDRKYFHKSSVNPKYSEWTVEGAEAVKDYLISLSTTIVIVEEDDLDRRAKELVMNNLKGDKY
jgi:hypothetical protein